MSPAHPVTRIASLFGVGSVVLFFKCSSLDHGITISLNGMVVAVVAIVLAFVGYVLGLRRRPRADSSETRIALVASCLTIVLSIGSWAVLTHRQRLASPLESWGADETAPRAMSQRPAWMTRQKSPTQVTLEQMRALY